LKDLEPVGRQRLHVAEEEVRTLVGLLLRQLGVSSEDLESAIRLPAPQQMLAASKLFVTLALEERGEPKVQRPQRIGRHPGL
jgi:hypothetical protein